MPLKWQIGLVLQKCVMAAKLCELLWGCVKVHIWGIGLGKIGKLRQTSRFQSQKMISFDDLVSHVKYLICCVFLVLSAYLRVINLAFTYLLKNWPICTPPPHTKKNRLHNFFRFRFKIYLFIPYIVTVHYFKVII